MKVYKYRSGNDSTISRDFASLVKNEIYSSPIDNLNDIFEAKFIVNEDSFALADLIFKSIDVNDVIKDTTAIEILNEYLNVVKYFGVYSLSKTFDDELLWAYYANSHRGFCIEYELNDLLEFRLKNEYVTDVKYATEVPVINFSDFFQSNPDDKIKLINDKLLATKSLRWKHEKEIRIITGQAGLKNYRFEALKSIYFGIRCDDAVKIEAMKLLKGRGVKYYQMTLGNGMYKMQCIPVIDQFANQKYQIAELAAVDDDIVFLNDNDIIFEDDLFKAIEIVSKRPDSKRIISADISKIKSTEGNVVFYVSYIANDDQYQKVYISKKEIQNYTND